MPWRNKKRPYPCLNVVHFLPFFFFQFFSQKMWVKKLKLRLLLPNASLSLSWSYLMAYSTQFYFVTCETTIGWCRIFFLFLKMIILLLKVDFSLHPSKKKNYMYINFYWYLNYFNFNRGLVDKITLLNLSTMVILVVLSKWLNRFKSYYRFNLILYFYFYLKK